MKFSIVYPQAEKPTSKFSRIVRIRAYYATSNQNASRTTAQHPSCFRCRTTKATDRNMRKILRRIGIIEWKTKIRTRRSFRSSYMVVTKISCTIFRVIQLFLWKFRKISPMGQRPVYGRGYCSIHMSSFNKHCTIIGQFALCPVGQGSITPLVSGLSI